MDDDVECWQAHLAVEVEGSASALSEIDSPAAILVAQPAFVEADVTLAFAVGADGGIWRYQDGGLQPMASPTQDALLAVWGSGPTDFWAAGASSRLHFDGQAWSALSPPPVALRAIWGSASNDVWFAGDQGTLLHWDGSGLVPAASGTTATLRGLGGTSSSDVWAVGDDGVALHFDGSTWSARPTGQTMSLRSVWSIDSAHVVIGTASGLLVWDGSFKRFDTGFQVNALHGHGQQWYGAGQGGMVLLGDLRVFSGGGSSGETVGGPLAGVFTDGREILSVGGAGRFVRSATSPRTGWETLPAGSAALNAIHGVRFVVHLSAGGGARTAPSITNTPGAIEVEPQSGRFEKIPIEWRDPGSGECGACTPQLCLMTCFRPGNASPRCSARSKCTTGARDGLVGGRMTLGVRYAAIPARTDAPLEVAVFPRIPDCACGGAVPTGRPVFVPTTVLVPKSAPSGGGGGSGGGSGSCEHCVSGQPCSACNGFISCAGKVCCPSGMTCNGSVCSNASGSSGTSGISVMECGATPRYTVKCPQGGCCPNCMTCNADGTCSLP